MASTEGRGSGVFLLSCDVPMSVFRWIDSHETKFAIAMSPNKWALVSDKNGIRALREPGFVLSPPYSPM